MLKRPTRRPSSPTTWPAVPGSYVEDDIFDTATASGLDAGDMSFSVPRNAPSFGNPNRQVEDHIWRAAGMSSKVSGIFENQRTLPMYKDKPYSYAASRRIRPMWRRKRTLLFLSVVVGLLYWFGVFSGHDGKSVTKPKLSWKGTQGAGKQNAAVWENRRDRVVEAFQLSWDSYHRHAWGKHLPRAACHAVVRRTATDSELQVTTNTTLSPRLDA